MGTTVASVPRGMRLHLRSLRAGLLTALVVVASSSFAAPPSPRPSTPAPRAAVPSVVARAPRPAAPATARPAVPAAARSSSRAIPRVGPDVAPLARMPKLIVYDWDGTLGDTYPQLKYVVSRAAEDLGIAPRPASPLVDPYRTIIDGAGLEVMFRRMSPAGTHAEEQAFIARYRAHTATAPPELITLKPGIREELDAIRTRHPDVKLAILSSRPQEVVESFAKHVGVASMFVKIVGTGHSKIAEKPSPEGLFVITRELGIAPSDAVMIGDTPMDVGAGKAAGMITIALRDGMGAEDTLVHAAPDRLLDGLSGFADHLMPRGERAAPALHPRSARDVEAPLP